MPDPKGTPTLEPRTWMAGSPALAFAAVLAVSGALPRLWPASMSERLEASLAYELVAIHSFLFFLVPIAMRPQMWWHHALRWS